MSQRTYHDPLHGAITFNGDNPAEALVIDLVDTAPFQRLRRIRQLGPAFLTFHGAESSRFTHSLGVCHVARRAFHHLRTCDPALEPYEGLLLAAALLHDVGHGPLSHTGEEMFGLHHESWSARLIREHPQLRRPLENYREGTTNAVAALLEEGRAQRTVIRRLVSGQLDCDRLDYLLRDSYSTGARYGHLDLDRVLGAMTLAPDGDLAIHPKGLMAVEHYLVVRNLMYRSVYNHRLNVMCNWLLEQLVRTARRMGPAHVWADSVMHTWLWAPNTLSLDHFLSNDDLRTGYHLQRWHEEGPQPLAELCGRFLNRRLLKVLAIEQLGREEQLKALAIAGRLAEQKGMDPGLCCGLRHQELRGYHPYRGGLRLWNGHQLQALETASALVASLTTPAAASWLIHPGEIEVELREAMKQAGLAVQ